MRSESFIVARSTIRAPFTTARSRFVKDLGSTIVAQKERHCHFRSGGSDSPRRPCDSESFRESRTFSFGSRLPNSSCFWRGRRNVHARRVHYLTDPDTPGLGGGLGRGLGVV